MEIKIAFLIIVVSISNLFATDTYSQVAKVSLDMENRSLEQVMDEIEKQSEFYFIFNQKQIDVHRMVDIQANGKLITEILPQLFEGTNVQYAVFDRKILLTTEDIGNSMVVSMLRSDLQQLSISGSVKDASTGEALPGVNVVIQGTTIGTITDVNGQYGLQEPAQNAVIVVTFIGYVSQSITYTGQRIVDVQLVPDVLALSEVVVTGYSTERRRDIIGAVAVVNTTELLSTPSGSVTNQLQGRASGVTISSDGAPGKSGRVRIRGFGSFGDSEPLYIIDGVPGDIDKLNPNDVASIQVLKDAASAAVYGSRAANGVIVVTTNQGSAGETKITFDSYGGINYVSKNQFPEVLNAAEWGEYFFRSLEGAGRQFGDINWISRQYGNGPTPVIPEYILVNDNGRKYGGAELEQLRTTNPTLFNSLTDPANYNFRTHQIVKSGDTNWAEEIFNPSPIQNYQLTASGGSDKGTFLLSLNYFDQVSTATKYSFYKRYSVRANSSMKIRNNIRLGENLQISLQDSRDVSMTGNAWTFHPLIPVYDIMGNPASTAALDLVSTAGDHAGHNPVTAPRQQRLDGQRVYSIFGNTYLEIDILKDITIKSSLGFDYSNRTVQNFVPISYENYDNNIPIADNLQIYSFNNTGLVWSNTATYNKTFNQHSFKLLIGSEAISTNQVRLEAVRFGFEPDLQDDEYFVVLDAGTGVQTNNGSRTGTRLFSLFSRFDYTYGDKYLFNATIRRDGSSKFGIENRYGIFPSAAIGWRISSESFMADVSWISDLKLRASTGTIGNQTGLDPMNQYYTYTNSDFQAYAISGANNNAALAYTVNRIGNPEARWERTTSNNIGFDATLLKGSLTLTADFFVRTTVDLLVPNQAPQTGSWATQPSVNVGSIRNRGLELNLSKRGTVAGNLDYEVAVSFSKYNNEVLKVLDNPLASIISGNNRTAAGYPMAYFYGYVIDGFFNTQTEVDEYNDLVTSTWLPPEVGRWRIKDISGPNGVPDNVINDYDRTMIGSPHPDFQTQFSLSLNYKNFDLFTSVFWSQGQDVYHSTRNGVDFNTMFYNRSKRMLYESWTPENMNAKLPILDITDTYSNRYATDYFVEDGSFIRMKTIQIGYSLPVSFAQKININNLRIYAQIQNPFTLTRFTGMDPDAGSSGNSTNNTTVLATRAADLQLGVTGNSTPTPQQIIFGVNLTF